MKKFNLKEWQLVENREDYKVQLAIIRYNMDGSRDVIMKDGKIRNIPRNKTINSVCGATIELEGKYEKSNMQ